MKSRRMIGIAALGAAAASMLLAPGASAQQAPTYAASADGQALGLLLFDNELTGGKTHAEIASTPEAKAEGAGILNPLSPVGITSAEVSGDGTDGSAEESCEGSLPDIPGLAADLACSSSIATIADGAPSSAATGRVGSLTVNPVQPLLDTPLAEVVEGVDGGVEQILDGLAPITGPIDEGSGLGVDATLRELFGALFDGADLVSITLGETESTTGVVDGAATATCVASGGRIDILDAAPVGEVDPAPVASIIIGDASASVVAPLTGADPTFEVNPAIATVIVPSLGINQPVGPGDVIEIPLPEPLGPSTISVAGGTTGTTDDGQTFARASAVRLDLLNGEALMGGIELSLADCLAVAGAEAALPQAAPPAEPDPVLPRTGGTTNGLALAGAVAFAGLGLALLRKRDIV